MQKIVFGDNQFFGINHMSEEKARIQSMRFQEVSSIIAVINDAYDAGIRAFMCTTHDRIAQVCDHFRKHSDRYPGFEFYPCMPYAHKYANTMTEHGPVEALRRLLPVDGAFQAALQGGVSVARRDVEGVAKLLIDAEMKMFHGLTTPIIFLQNVVCDLLLGAGFFEGFRIFSEHVQTKYGAEPGFITMNLPRLLDGLEIAGVHNPIVCANINKVGFRMSGGVDVYEATIRERQFRPMAMSVLASGAVEPYAAVEYVASLRSVQSVVFGASSRSNIQETTRLIKELIP